MNRNERRRAAALGRDGQTLLQDQLRLLQAENAELRRQLDYAVKIHNMQATVIAKARETGSLTIQIQDDVPSNEMYVPVKTLQTYEQEIKSVVESERAFYFAISNLREVIARVDTAAAGYSDTQLREALYNARLDEKLAAALTGVIRHIDEPDPAGAEMLMQVQKYVADRIHGIQKIKHDRGRRLREIVAASEGQWGELAARMMEKARQGPQQANPKTERLAEYAHTAKYDGRRRWRAAALAILDDLQNRREALDAVDADILRELEYQNKQYGAEKLADYVKTAYHGYHRREAQRQR